MTAIGVYAWWKFAHILGAFAFVMAHGVSVGVMFRIRKERNRERLRALLELSAASLLPMYAGLLLLIVGGIGVGITGGWWEGGFWSSGWTWVSIALLIVTTGAMSAMGRPYFAGLKTGLAPDATIDDAELEALLQGSGPMVVAAIGFTSLTAIIWLMVTKPF